MMNNGPTAMPFYPGRRQQNDASYNLPPPQPSVYPHPYSSYGSPPYPHSYHHPQAPPSWAYYQNMHPNASRSMGPFPQPVMNPPYPYPPQGFPPSASPRPAYARASPSYTGPRPPAERRPPAAPEQSKAPAAVPDASVRAPSPEPIFSGHRESFQPKLPWYSDPNSPFPPAQSRRHKKRRPPPPDCPFLQLPPRPTFGPPSTVPANANATISSVPSAEPSTSVHDPPTSLADPRLLETPSTSQAPSDTESTQPTTPSSTIQSRAAPAPSGLRPQARIAPAVPIVPNLANGIRRNGRPPTSPTSDLNRDHLDNGAGSSGPAQSQPDVSGSDGNPQPAASIPQPAAAPRSWADLVRVNAPNGPINGTQTPSSTDANHAGQQRKKPLAEFLHQFSLDQEPQKIAFTKPRGLINTGNMCYMNSVFQVLLHCVPFYDLMSQIGARSTHAFQSDTPLIDAIVMFLNEFSVIDAARDAELLRKRLKDPEYDDFGEPFIPEFVYEAIRPIARFASMRRGHQQDAEEFLGFLLEQLHEDCTKIMKATEVTKAQPRESTAGEEAEQGWLEVGPRQKASITRSSGVIDSDSPITKIFGGKLRSELRVPGAKNSVTLEPYQALQLDVSSPQVVDITDALKGLTRSEVLHGAFQSPRGPGVTATKQVFIETLPPVLILHLKRFQYDNAGGTQKIWKQIGYPLELEIPKEAFAPYRRGQFTAARSLPRYRLTGVVYHHGKSASGGHYTVDVRRQDGREWIRFDDTVIRRIQGATVVSESTEKTTTRSSGDGEVDRLFSGDSSDGADSDDEARTSDQNGWQEVNGSAHAGTPAASKVENSSTSPTGHARSGAWSAKDNKVAYLLFYERQDAKTKTP